MKVALLCALVAGTVAMSKISEYNEKYSSPITVGEKTGETEFPHQVSLQKQENDGSWIEFCSGALYDETRILTSAFCLIGPGSTLDWRIVAGAHDLNFKSGHEQIRNISAVATHEDFDYMDLENGWDSDISILTVSAPLVFNSRVQPIRLAESTAAPTVTGVMSGYGPVEVDSGNISMKLQKALVKIKENLECSGIYKNVTGFPKITDTNLCTEAEGTTSTCFIGEIGSPLVAKDGANRDYLAGLASWSFLICDPQLPNVFTNIAALRKWLDSKLNL